MKKTRSIKFPGLTTLVVLLMVFVMGLWNRNRMPDTERKSEEFKEFWLEFPSLENLARTFVF